MGAALQTTMTEAGFGDFAYCQIANAPNNRQLNGSNIKQAAARRLEQDDAAAQIRTVLELIAEAQGRSISMVYHKMCEDDVATILRLPFVAVASDAGIRVPGDSKPHPRGSGNNPRVLGRYGREQGVLPLALAIHKMTALPAKVFGFADRGVVRVGAWADLVVFDPATVGDRATYEDPLLAPVGMPFVLVNGVVVVENGQHTGARPGKVLRHQQ
jgi:N-acyl-D-amino-acid deacylase